MTALIQMFSYHFMQRALIVGVLVSLCAALLGVSLVLKRYSMIGDGLSHVGFGALAVASALNLAPLAVAVPALMAVSANLLPRLFPADKLLLALTNFLCALGVLVLYSTNPAYAYQQALYYGVGVAAMVICIYLVRLVKSWHAFSVLVTPLSLALLALPVASIVGALFAVMN